MGKQKIPDANYISNSEIRSQGRAVKPKDAATLIIVDTQQDTPTVLMGKRSAKHSFMPNKYVFPGGKTDRCDSYIKPPFELHPDVQKRLSKGCSANKARALALAAIRETFEETGLIIGENKKPLINSRAPAWNDFLQHGFNPRLDQLQFVARAITPPGSPRRFDARFFITDASGVHGTLQGNGELLDLQWIKLEETSELELPTVTSLVLELLKRKVQGNAQEALQVAQEFEARHGREVFEYHV